MNEDKQADNPENWSDFYRAHRMKDQVDKPRVSDTSPPSVLFRQLREAGSDPVMPTEDEKIKPRPRKKIRMACGGSVRGCGKAQRGKTKGRFV